MNLRLLEDRIEGYYRKIIDLEDELVNIDYSDKDPQDIKDDIKYYQNLQDKAEEKYLDAGGKNLA
tara:strand:- start:317 stop:511 length:195 start_codon:yes stop_codon:yes gene_type:complete